jgi:hypothetical protein
MKQALGDAPFSLHEIILGLELNFFQVQGDSLNIDEIHKKNIQKFRVQAKPASSRVLLVILVLDIGLGFIGLKFQAFMTTERKRGRSPGMN